MTRAQASAGTGCVYWNPEAAIAPALDATAPTEAVIHLAGESLRTRRWTARKKQSIRSSRIAGMQLLCRALAALPRKPRVLAFASAGGYYGDRGDEWLEETSGAGSGFLADVCRELEAASQAAEAAGIRAVALRLGVVLSGQGGAMDMMLPAFRMGVGGPFGDGRQFLSWIALEDALDVIEFAVASEGVRGAINAVAPESVRNREFVRTLGRVLRRPAIVPLPAPVMRLLMGELADELLLASQRVRPARLLEAGFAFRQPRLEAALRGMVG